MLLAFERLYPVKTLNSPYSTLSTRRRYEVWFLRFALADGSGAWWFRYLLINLGKHGCTTHSLGMPAQVWATWFPADGRPQTFIEGFSLKDLRFPTNSDDAFRLAIAENRIDDNSCVGHLRIDGHEVSWNLNYSSNFAFTMSSKGWIGFSRTPHADAIFQGIITLDDRRFEGSPLGFGLQGHNCGYRHRNHWCWTHACFHRPSGQASIFEALMYEMPMGLTFRKVVLWLDGKQYVFRNLQDVRIDRDPMRWSFRCAAQGAELDVVIDGSGTSVHRLPYLKTDCSGTFEVMNNSRAHAQLRFNLESGLTEELETSDGAVLEIVGQQ